MIIDNSNYKNLLKHFHDKIKRFSTSDQKIILSAFELSKKFHYGMTYAPDQPFIVHPSKVTMILLNLGVKDNNMICAALLHDTVEDTDMTYGHIEKLFNINTVKLVKGLTREKTGPETSEQRFANKKKKFKETLKKSKSIRLIKCCDWLSNLSNWTQISKNHPWAKKFPRWQKEAHELYLPLAKATDRTIYHEMQKQLKIFEGYVGVNLHKINN